MENYAGVGEACEKIELISFWRDERLFVLYLNFFAVYSPLNVFGDDYVRI